MWGGMPDGGKVSSGQCSMQVSQMKRLVGWQTNGGKVLSGHCSIQVSRIRRHAGCLLLRVWGESIRVCFDPTCAKWRGRGLIINNI